uniref:Uncharacterized protein n=2 Tax=Oryza meridionalis TaxID=40149 RepID=A0A0E0DHE2_9ORYZ
MWLGLNQVVASITDDSCHFILSLQKQRERDREDFYYWFFLGSSTSSLSHVPARDLPRAVWFEVDLSVVQVRFFLGSSTSSLSHVPARDLPRAVWFEVDLSVVQVRLVGCMQVVCSCTVWVGWRLAWARAYLPTENFGFIRFKRKIKDLNTEGLIFTRVI